MPYSRQRRPHLSSVQTNQVDLEGSTYLCFPKDHAWFQGNINTDGESSYTLYGQRLLSPNPQELIENKTSQCTKNHLNNNNNDESSNGLNNMMPAPTINNNDKNGPETDYYRVTLTDHFTGLSYHLPNIGVNPISTKENKGPEVLFTCSSDADVKFKVDNIYRGQKADMIIQKFGGLSTTLGHNCLVYSGPISISFTEVIDTGRNWCL